MARLALVHNFVEQQHQQFSGTFPQVEQAGGQWLAARYGRGLQEWREHTLSQNLALVTIVFGLVVMSGIMAGLTLGLLSLDSVDLEVVRRTGRPTEKRCARRILPIITHKHWLLVTLVLINAACNEAMPIFLDQLVSPLVAVIIATTVVLLFGEILPQALCARYGIRIGGFCSAFVKLLMLVTAPISWPLGKLLDGVLGREEVLHGRRQLKTYVSLHGQQSGLGGCLTPDEIKVIRGTLDLYRKTARCAMTSMDHVFMLSADQELNRDTLHAILAKGHSRVPVYRRKPGGDKEFLGIILVKELLQVDPDAHTKAGELSLRPLPRLPANTPLFDMLKLFETGRSHMALLVQPKGTPLPPSILPSEVGDDREEDEVSCADEYNNLLPAQSDTYKDQTDGNMRSYSPSSSNSLKKFVDFGSKLLGLQSPDVSASDQHSTNASSQLYTAVDPNVCMARDEGGTPEIGPYHKGHLATAAGTTVEAACSQPYQAFTAPDYVSTDQLLDIRTSDAEDTHAAMLADTGDGQDSNRLGHSSMAPDTGVCQDSTSEERGFATEQRNAACTANRLKRPACLRRSRSKSTPMLSSLWESNRTHSNEITSPFLPSSSIALGQGACEHQVLSHTPFISAQLPSAATTRLGLRHQLHPLPEQQEEQPCVKKHIQQMLESQKPFTVTGPAANFGDRIRDALAEGEPVGIITLEDVIEEMMQVEIVDETDQYVDNEQTTAAHTAAYFQAKPPGNCVMHIPPIHVHRRLAAHHVGV